MKKQLDIKSMLIGILLSLCCVFALGATTSTNSNPNGRFQLATPGEGNNVYIIDTTTGEVWEKYPVGTQKSIDFRMPKIEKNS